MDFKLQKIINNIKEHIKTKNQFTKQFDQMMNDYKLIYSHLPTGIKFKYNDVDILVPYEEEKEMPLEEKKELLNNIVLESIQEEPPRPPTPELKPKRKYTRKKKNDI